MKCCFTNCEARYCRLLHPPVISCSHTLKPHTVVPSLLVFIFNNVQLSGLWWYVAWWVWDGVVGYVCCLHLQVGRLPAGSEFVHPLLPVSSWSVNLCHWLSCWFYCRYVTDFQFDLFSRFSRVKAHACLCACTYMHTCTQKMLLNQWSDCRLIEHNAIFS